MKRILTFIMASICAFGCLFAAGCSSSADNADDSFKGLYDEIEKTEPEYTYTNENMLYDFEEKESCYRNISFSSVFGSVSQNTDKKYVSCGNGSMKVVVNGRSDGSWSMITFAIPSEYSDFTSVKSIMVDVMYETEDNHDQIVSLGVWSSSGNRCETEGIVRAKNGEWFTLRIAMHDVMYACTIGSVWNYGVKWKDEYMKSMSSFYISLPPFAQGQKPAALYIDNVRVDYLSDN